MLTGTTPQPVSPVGDPPRRGRAAGAATTALPLPQPLPLPSPLARSTTEPDVPDPALFPPFPVPPAVEPSHPAARAPRSLVGIAPLPLGTLFDLLARALRNHTALNSATGAGGHPGPLQGRRIVTLFYENSTRTAQSFHLAAHRLGATAFDLPVSRSSVHKGESLRDTLRTCEALGFDAVILRHPLTGAAAYAASVLGVPVINAGDGTGEHPTQALLDALTVITRKGWPAGLKVAIVGDVRHGRVARSNALLMARLGAEVWLCGPPGLLPVSPPCPGVTVTPRLHEALDGADVVMALRIQRERLAGVLPDLGEYRRGWGIGPRQLEWARPDAILMHPGPVNRGIELDPAVMDDPRCVIEDQVRCGVAARMAVLEWALEAARPAGAADEPAGDAGDPGAGATEPGSGSRKAAVGGRRVRAGSGEGGRR